MDQDSDESISYEYNVNVRDKVKKLEAGRRNLSVSKSAVKNKPTPTTTVDIVDKVVSKDSTPVTKNSPAMDNSPAAVMDVEITQINSTYLPINQNSTITRNTTKLETNSDSDEDTPVSVKTLLRRFSSGVTTTFRKKQNQEQVDSRDNTDTSKKLANNAVKPQTVVDLNSDENDNRSETIKVNLETTTSNKSKIAPVKTTHKLPSPSSVTSTATKTTAPKSAEVKVITGASSSTTSSKEKNSTQVAAEGRNSAFGLSKIIAFPMTLRRGSKSQEREVETNPKAKDKCTEEIPVQVNAVQKRLISPPEKSLAEELAIANDKNDDLFPKPKPRARTTNNEPQIPSNLSLKRPSISGFQETPEIFETETVLVIGPGHGGKSSIVNYLMHQDLSTVHKSKSSEQEIVECTIKTTIGTKSEETSSLILIDAPGFTNNVAMDAAMFSSLFMHLDNFSTLDTKPPRIILTVIKIDDLQTAHGSDAIQNFLKALAYYHQTMFSGFPKILFVISHAAKSEIPKIRVVKENLSTLMEQHFPISNFQTCFHNMNHSLKDSSSEGNVKSLTTSYADLVTGLRWLLETEESRYGTPSVLKHILGPTYPKTLTACFVSKRISLRSIEHPETVKVQKTLQNVYQNVSIEPTEIATLLEIGWENVGSKLRKKYPSALITLQQVLQRCQLKNFSELPEDPIKVFELLKHIPQHNPATTDLLTETLQLKIPSCYSALYLGQGYDVSKDAVTHVTPFNFSGSLKTSPVGLIPVEMSYKLTEDREIIFKFFGSVEDYVMSRFNDLNIKHVTLPKNGASVTTLFANQRIGYNTVRPSQEPTKTTTATANVEYRIFQLSLPRGEDIEFKPQFWDTLSSLPELDIKNAETVDCWGEFFKYWGTHIVKAAYGGGSIQVTFRGKILTSIFKSINQKSVLSPEELETSKVFEWITGDGLDFARVQNSNGEFLPGCDVDTKFHGGDLRFQQTDLTKLFKDKASSAREEWLQSLPLHPVILETNLVLVPLSYFIREKSEGFATKMDIAFLHFYSNFMASQGRQSSCSIL